MACVINTLGVVSLLVVAASAASPAATAHYPHLDRRHHGDMSDVVRRRQIDARQAMTKWQAEGGLVKRSTASATACSSQVAAYGQCGGTGYTGSTCCVAGYTCAYDNAYWSACTPDTTSSCSNSGYGQCGGSSWTGATCCPADYVCTFNNAYYSQCVPGTSTSTTSTSTSTTTSATTTSTTSTGPTATSTCPAATITCNAASGGSDGCTPYSVTPSGVVLPAGTTFPAFGHVNYQAIPCAQYSTGETYLKPGSDWTPTSYGTNFDPNNNQPGGVYIGESVYDFSGASAAYGGSFCVTWVQVSMYNQHWGEGGQPPVCSAQCCNA